MTFISFNYALFLLIVLGIYWSMPRQSWRVFILLIASLIFYATIQSQYIPLLLIITLLNFHLAQAIGEPKDWRIANITPIFKKGSKSLAENYRPISLTSIICKLFESIICDFITQHLNENNALNSS